MTRTDMNKAVRLIGPLVIYDFLTGSTAKEIPISYIAILGKPELHSPLVKIQP